MGAKKDRAAEVMITRPMIDRAAKALLASGVLDESYQVSGSIGDLRPIVSSLLSVALRPASSRQTR